jgi:hypothetical protein
MVEYPQMKVAPFCVFPKYLIQIVFSKKSSARERVIFISLQLNERQEYAYFELFAYALPNFLRTPCK